MKIFYPYKSKPTITQWYSQNLNTYYSEAGLLGHGAIDMWRPHGSEILCGVNGYVFSIINKDNKDLMRYRCVYTLVEEDGITYEVSYGHLGNIYVKEGDNLKVGDLIGTQSNTGNVASGGIKVTKEMKALGLGQGSHLHFQVRLLKRVDKKEKGKNYLFKKINGYYYEIPLYENGFNGCIDPKPFLQDKTAYAQSTSIFTQIVNVINQEEIKRTLRYGMRGDDVKILQEMLGGLKIDGVFGRLTDKAVRDFQSKNKLLVDGIVGRQTKSKFYDRNI